MKFAANIVLRIDQYEAADEASAEKKLSEYIDLVVDLLSKSTDIRQSDISWTGVDYDVLDIQARL